MEENDRSNLPNKQKSPISRIQLRSQINQLKVDLVGFDTIAKSRLLQPVAYSDEKERAVILNLVNNGFQPVQTKLSDLGEPSSAANQTVLNRCIPLVLFGTKYTSMGGVVKGSLSKHKGQEQIQISIQDNDPGIPDDIKVKIFQPVFGTKPGRQGKGLGFSLKYHLSEVYHGQLKLRTKAYPGSGFVIQLPVKRVG